MMEDGVCVMEMVRLMARQSIEDGLRLILGGGFIRKASWLFRFLA